MTDIIVYSPCHAVLLCLLPFYPSRFWKFPVNNCMPMLLYLLSLLLDSNAKFQNSFHAIAQFWLKLFGCYRKGKFIFLKERICIEPVLAYMLHAHFVVWDIFCGWQGYCSFDYNLRLRNEMVYEGVDLHFFLLYSLCILRLT